MSLFAIEPLLSPSLDTQGYLLHRKSFDAPLLPILSGPVITAAAANLPLFLPLTESELADESLLEFASGQKSVVIVPEQIQAERLEPLVNRQLTLAVESSAPPEHGDIRYWIVRQENVGSPQAFPPQSTVVTGVADWDTCRTLCDAGVQLLAGPFHYKPLLRSEKSGDAVSPIKTNLIQLMNIVRDENYEFSSVADLVRQDPALSLSLMRLVNSPFIGLRNRVKSIPQAVTLLGQMEVRKWITTAVFKSMGTDRPNELTRGSLLRAKFMENLAPLYGQESVSDSLFLVGLFSALDGMLGVSINEALGMVPVAGYILSALLDRVGPHAPVLQFILDYEAAAWDQIDKHCKAHSLQEGEVLQAYLNALAWYNDLLD